MGEEPPQHPITKKRVVYAIPGMNSLKVRRDLVYATKPTGELTLDIYYPSQAEGKLLPAVIFVTGFPDPGYKAKLGCLQKDMGSYTSWAQLTAASGMIAITYVNENPKEDINQLFSYLIENGASLGVDSNQLGVWACSSNAANALAVLMQYGDLLECGVLCYGFMMDFNGATTVAEASKTWGFVNPAATKSIDDLSDNTPLFIVRAGKDENPGLNASIDSFLAAALSRNLPVSFVNHPNGPHAFDLMLNNQASCQIIKRILDFMQVNLGIRSI